MKDTSANRKSDCSFKRKTIFREFDLTGIVQGVGLRPAVCLLAENAGLGGWIQNRTGLVRLRLEGDEPLVTEFMRRLPDSLPSNAKLETVREIVSGSLPDEECSQDFRILESVVQGNPAVVIPADLAICDDCRKEVLDPQNRRYGYPFTTCTRCGPRYTVVNAMPYDRSRTTLSCFPMCPLCNSEYDNPRDRRFHAESIACPDCGPQLSLVDDHGEEIKGDPVFSTRKALAEGRVVGVRGIGGFLLAANAYERKTLKALRCRKNRPDKPFAVMARDISVVRRICALPPGTEELLLSPEAPIVILDVLPDVIDEGKLPMDLLAPDTRTLGVMLPTSPLHLLLFMPLKGDVTPEFDLLVMTSGNRRGEPICLTNREAQERLAGIADMLLCHDREINLRADDSIAVIREHEPQLWRRARGYAPNAIRLNRPLRRCVLAMGAEIKSTVAAGYGDRVVVSPHIGDLETPEALDSLQQVAESLPRFLNRAYDAVAVDLHPDMHSSTLGRRLAAGRGVPVFEVQHHHAHAAAVLAEHGHESGLVLVMDGSGLGTDGRIWGAELLSVNPDGFRRLGTFLPVLLPGGDAAVRHPIRQLMARFVDCGVALNDELLNRFDVREEDAAVWSRQCAQRINAPFTHAAGRVFDSFAALLGVAPSTVTYEAQSAIRLESAAATAGHPAKWRVPFRSLENDGMLYIDWRPAFLEMAQFSPGRASVHEAAFAVHCAVAEAAVEMIHYGLSQCGISHVALSGGVFMNRILNDLVTAGLRQQGVAVLLHRHTPPNDGCIAFGQAAIAGYRDL